MRVLTNKAINKAATHAAGRIATRLFLADLIAKPNKRTMLRMIRETIAECIRAHSKEPRVR